MKLLQVYNVKCQNAFGMSAGILWHNFNHKINHRRLQQRAFWGGKDFCAVGGAGDDGPGFGFVGLRYKGWQVSCNGKWRDLFLHLTGLTVIWAAHYPWRSARTAATAGWARNDSLSSPAFSAI